MVNRVLGNVYTVAGLWVAFLAYGIFLFNYGLYPAVKKLSNQMDLPEELYGPTLDYQAIFLERLGEQGIEQYASFQWFDFLNAILLGLVVSSTIFLIIEKLELHRNTFYLAALPIVTAVADILENIVMLQNLRNLPELEAGLASVYSFLTQAKFITGTISFFLLVTMIVVFAVRVIGKRIGKK